MKKLLMSFLLVFIPSISFCGTHVIQGDFVMFSSMTITGSSISVSGLNYILQSTPTFGTSGDDILHRNRVSSFTYWGGDNAGSGIVTGKQILNYQ